MDSNNSTESQFKQQLTVYINPETKSVLMTKEEYFNLIEELKVANTLQTAKTNRQYYILKRYVKY
jgi:hypothetical protein